jgi:RNA polymerase sigma-70 factor, ECF subfamily
MKPKPKPRPRRGASRNDLPFSILIDADGPDLTVVRSHLSRAVARVCPGWLADRRDDIIQSALIRVTNIAAREGKAPLAASYLWKAAYSATVDEIRRVRRLRESPLEEVEAEGRGNRPVLEVAERADPERRAGSREVGAAIRACLAGLMADRRRAVALHLQGHTIPECGRLLGWDAKRAENLAYRGMQDLRACLEQKGITP